MCLWSVCVSAALPVSQSQLSASVSLKTQQLSQQLQYLFGVEQSAVVARHTAFSQQQADWARTWCRDEASLQRMLSNQVQGEEYTWTTFLQQRDERRAISGWVEQRRAAAGQLCDELVRQTLADKDEADKGIKLQKALQREIKVQLLEDTLTQPSHRHTALNAADHASTEPSSHPVCPPVLQAGTATSCG